jgi:apolipoprotein D and lipocalin family protein
MKRLIHRHLNQPARTGIICSVAAFSLLLTACAGADRKDTLPTVSSVDLTRYAGTWYEIARLPTWFQRHCVDSKAVYTSRPDGAFRVHNECVTDSGGVEQAEGVATVVDASTNARLLVLFDNFFARLFGSSHDGNYWILSLDPEYRTAMVGTPDRRYLWILSRSPQLDDESYQRLVQRAKELGFPVPDLIRTRRSELSIPRPGS